MKDGPVETARPRAPLFNKGAFYRTCRMLHAYFSAAAFVTLAFFSVTGLMLNHPEWLGARRAPAPVEVVALDAARIDAALAADDPGAALAAAVRAAAPIRGAYRDAEVIDTDAFLRFTGVSGASDVAIDLESGAAEIETRRANLTSVLHDLHRGKDAGAAWKLAIDISAIIILAMSLIGGVLFFSLRFRFATSMALLAAGGLALVALALFAVP